MTDMLTAPDENEAVEMLHALRCTDGLPVVVPTRERVDRLVLASGQDGDMVLGTMGPAGGIATVEKVAVAAVMAGCLPDHMPVVMAAVQAVIDPAFDLTEMQSTTHCTAPLIIVNGPARQACGGITGGFGALGPGHRANASIGRALRLAMLNIGGARPGESDMALLGHPGKFTYCLAEDEESSPFPPLHTSLGFQAEDSVVTVIGAEAPHSVLYSPTGDASEDARCLAEMLAIGISNLATNNAQLRNGAAVVVLNPEHAQVFQKANLGRESVQKILYGYCFHPPELLRSKAGGFAPRGEDRGPVHAFRSHEDILVLVAGGSGLYSMVMPTWCAGPHVNRFVTRPVLLNAFCEIA
ncbi:MAG: hypothetical protein H6994_10245 [Pseudomonadales bacterium]|nr:hypothetical protein [Pseudomonadales bacterium]